MANRKPFYGIPEYHSGIAAPDLSGTAKLASQMGKNSALADFYELLNKQKAEADKAAAADAKLEQAAATKDLGNEPQSQSFWDKLGQNAGDALWGTLDFISRPLYGVTNAFEGMAKEAYQGDDSITKGIGAGAKGFWEGITGHDKTDFIKLIAEQGARDPGNDWRDNKWAQAGVGLGMDLFADPLSYIGLGIVTKPFKTANEIKGVKAVDEGTIKDLVGLGLKKEVQGERVPITANQYRSILGESKNINARPAAYKSMTRRERRAWDKAHTLKGIRVLPRSEAIASSRQRIENLDKVYKALKEAPELEIDASSAIRKLIDDTQAELATAVDQYGKRAYRSALTKFDEAKALEGLRGGKTVEKLDRIVSVNSLRTGLKAKQFVDRGQAVNGGYNNAKTFEDTFSFLKSDRLSDEFKTGWSEQLKSAKGERVFNEATGEWEKSPYFKAVDKVEWLQKEKARRTSELNRVAEQAGTNSQKYKYLRSKLNGVEDDLKEAHHARDVAEAETLHRLVARDANLKAMRADPAFAAPVGKIEARLEVVQRGIDRLEAQGTDVHSSVVPSKLQDAKQGLEGSDEAGNVITSDMQDELKTLKSERSDLRKHLDALEHKYYRDNPDKAFWNSKVSDAPILHKPGPDAPAEEVSLWEKARHVLWRKRTEEIYQQKVATESRKLRADTGKETKLIETLTGGKGDGVLRTHAGLSLKDKDELVKLATKADKAAAKKVAKDGTTTPLHSVVFQRLFKKDHGISVEEGYDKLNKFKGKTVSLGGAKEYTKREYVEAIVGDPGQFARSGHGMPIPKEYLPHADDITKTRINFTNFRKVVQSDKIGMSNIEAQRAWDDAFVEYFKQAPAHARAAAASNFDYRLNLKVNETKHGLKDVQSSLDNPSLSSEARAELRQQAEKEAKDEIDARDSIPNLTNDGIAHNFGPEPVTIDDEHKLLIDKMKHDFAEEQRMIKLNNPDSRSKPAKLLKELEQLQIRFNEEKQAAELAYKEAVRARDAMKVRLEENIDLNALDEAIREGQNYIRVSLGKAKLADIYLPSHIIDAVEKASGLPLIKQTRQAWSQAFKPSSSLEPEMNLARLRAQSETANIIKHHLMELKKNFSEYKPKDRNYALALLREGKSPVGDLAEKLDAQFKDIARYTSGMVNVADEPLMAHEINKFLPEPFNFIHPKGRSVNELNLNSTRNILAAMRSLPKDADPMKVLWALRIATEQAMAKKALQHTIKQTFGVKRIMKNEHTLENDNVHKLVEVLHKDHDWIQNKNIGASHYFPRDVSEQIDKLFEMTEPQKVAKIMRGYDKTLRVWKSAVTVYNPGYYARNAIGEFTMNVFDGVNDVRHYQRAMNILTRKMPDATKETLKKMEPWKNRLTDAQAGSRVAVTLKGGHTLTSDEVWILYNDVGLKSGFISTEYDHLFPAANSMRANPVGQMATKINDSMRFVGEKQEDYYRLAHFISRLERSAEGKFTKGATKEIKEAQILKAAEDAGEYVRKYHFDYTDFTPFEKATMLRIIPFYKWTRKAMPLMAGMLFTQPGKISMYPKAMSALSVGMGGTDPLTDTNGFAPNYEDVVPEWIKNMGAYPMGNNFMGDDTGSMTYMNVATPAFDVYKMMQNPLSATISMLSPGIKVPLEQASGDTLDPDFNIEFDKVPGSRRDNLMRMTPATSLYEKMHDNKDTSQTWASFMSGLGFYQNSEARQKGEKMRQNFDK